MATMSMKSINLTTAAAASASSARLGQFRRRQEAAVVIGGWLTDRDGAGRLEILRRRREGLAILAGENEKLAGNCRAPRRGASRLPSKRQASRRSQSSVKKAAVSGQQKKKTQKIAQEVDDFGDDAFEALFAQLEMDLEADDSSDIEDFTEEEVIELENELSNALTDIEAEEKLVSADTFEGDSAQELHESDTAGPSPKPLTSGENRRGGRKSRAETEEEIIDVPLDDFEDEEDEQRIVDLQPWQLKKLAAAVELGRRKVNIKALCAETGLDRFDVLAWLKDPPPELLMQCAAMVSEEDAAKLPSNDVRPDGPPTDSVSPQEQVEVLDPSARRDWNKQKRLRKENEATFERVYRKTQRPTNAMVQNMVELTHVPRKRIVEWFEQRRESEKPTPRFEALK